MRFPRPARWAVAAALPALWLAVAWVDARFVVLALACGGVAAGAVHLRERRRPPDEPLVL